MAQTIGLLNDSFPPLIDGVANTVVNYAAHLTQNGDSAVVMTPYYPDIDDSAFPFPVLRYPSIDTTRLVGYRAGAPFSTEIIRYLKDYRLFTNSIRVAVDQLRDVGAQVDMEQTDVENGMDIVIHVRRPMQ